MTHISDLANKYFKATYINIFKELKKNMFRNVKESIVGFNK